MFRAILSTVVLTFLVTPKAAAVEPSEDKASPTTEAQAIALRCVIDFFLKTDPDKAARYLAPNATYRSNRSSATKMIDELRELQQTKKPFPAIREIGFFTSQDIPKIQKRLRVYRGAANMFQKKRIPAHLKDGFACYIVTYPLKIGERGMTAVIVMIFHKIGDEHKIVYIDDN